MFQSWSIICINLSFWNPSLPQLREFYSSISGHSCISFAYLHPPTQQCWTFKTLCALVQLLSHVQLFVTPWIAIHQARLSSNVSGSLLKYMFIELVILSKHLILCHSFLPLPSIFSSIRVFSNELALHIRWPKYQSFSFSISPSNEY